MEFDFSFDTWTVLSETVGRQALIVGISTRNPKLKESFVTLYSISFGLLYFPSAASWNILDRALDHGKRNAMQSLKSTTDWVGELGLYVLHEFVLWIG